MSCKQYALYKGDELLMVGPVYAIAKARGVSVDTIHWLASPTNRKRAENSKRGRLFVERISEDD